MLLSIPPLVALCWVCLCRRDKAALSEVRLQCSWAAAAALAIESLVAHVCAPGWQAITLVSFAGLLLLLFVCRNHRLAGIRLIAVGIGLNFAAMLANGGFMPVGVTAAMQAGLPTIGLIGSHVAGTKDVLLPTTDQHLALLGDWLALPSWCGVLSKTVYSLGDVILSSGVCCCILHSTTRLGVTPPWPTARLQDIHISQDNPM